MQINLVLFRPPGFAHGGVFSEIMDLYEAHLQDLGHAVGRTINRLRPNRLNLLFGSNLVSPVPAPLLGLHFIVCQLELLAGPDDPHRAPELPFHPSQLDLLRHARQVWDFAPENVAFLRRHGVNVRHIPVGYHPALHRVEHAPERDVDVLFYGSISPRRDAVLRALEAHCRVQRLFGVYGRERDGWIGRSEVVLSMHYRADRRILEQVRLSYLLNNGCAVVAEESWSTPYRGGYVELPYDRLVEGTLALLERAEARARMAQQGLEALRQVDMRGRIEAALAALDEDARP